MPTNAHLVKAMLFPVVMYGCENWAIRKAECQRIDAFELWCWKRLLRVPWTARRSHQSILKELSPEYSLEGLMLKLKLQYFGHLMQRTDSFEKTLMLGKIEGRRRRGWQRMRWSDGITITQWTWVWGSSRSWWWTGRAGVLWFMGLPRVRDDCVTELNWTASNALTGVWLFVTPWTAAHQSSLSFTISWSLLKFMSIESMMPSNHLIFCHPLLHLPSIFPSIRVFSKESVLHIRWPKYWSFSFSTSPSNEYSGLISFRTDWL